MDVGTVLAAVASSTLIATSLSAVVSWKVASGQRQVEREKLNYERDKHEHEKRSRKRDDARSICQQVVDELAFMAASMQLLHDNWRIWKDREDDEETTGEQIRQVYGDVNAVNARMPRLLSDLFAVPNDLLPDEAWDELRELVLQAQQTYGHTVMDALGGEYPPEAFGRWLLAYGKANMTARRLITEIG